MSRSTRFIALAAVAGLGSVAGALVAGQPPRKVAAGEAIVVPGGTVHTARNSGSAPVRALSIYVVDKSKPLATPASVPMQ